MVGSALFQPAQSGGGPKESSTRSVDARRTRSARTPASSGYLDRWRRAAAARGEQLLRGGDEPIERLKTGQGLWAGESAGPETAVAAQPGRQPDGRGSDLDHHLAAVVQLYPDDRGLPARHELLLAYPGRQPPPAPRVQPGTPGHPVHRLFAHRASFGRRSSSREADAGRAGRRSAADRLTGFPDQTTTPHPRKDRRC